MVRYRESPCIENPYDPLACTVTGEWTSYYMRACGYDVEAINSRAGRNRGSPACFFIDRCVC